MVFLLLTLWYTFIWSADKEKNNHNGHNVSLREDKYNLNTQLVDISLSLNTANYATLLYT